MTRWGHGPVRNGAAARRALQPQQGSRDRWPDDRGDVLNLQSEPEGDGTESIPGNGNLSGSRQPVRQRPQPGQSHFVGRLEPQGS